MNNLTLTNKYKNRTPEETIEIIENFFKSKNCVLKKFNDWVSEADTYSCKYQLFFHDNLILETSGKGTTEIYAKASCFGEMYERFCAFPVATWNCINCNHLREIDNSKEVDLEEIINGELERPYLVTMFPDLNKDIIKKYLQIRSGDKFYKLLYKNINQNSDKKEIYFYSPLRIYANTSNGFSAGNTIEEAIIQGISELYEREVEMDFLNNKKEKYYYLNKDLLPQYLKNIIANIEALNYKIKIFDLSYNFKKPVAMVLLINNLTNKYFMHFGAFPIIDIAIERCLTEFYQCVINSDKEKNRKILITENEVTKEDILGRCISGGYAKEIIIDNLLLNSQQINHCNDLIFLQEINHTDEELIAQINKINTINNQSFYYQDLSLSDKIFAIHIVPDDYSKSIYFNLLEEINDFYINDNADFYAAINLAYELTNILKKICKNNQKINNDEILVKWKDLLKILPKKSNDEMKQFLEFTAYLLGIDFTTPYKCWTATNSDHNEYLLNYFMGDFTADIFNTDTDFAKNLIPWVYFYLYCIKNNNSLEKYNKIINEIGYKAINIDLDSFTPATWINNAVLKNFQSIYNTKEYFEFINLFKKEGI